MLAGHLVGHQAEERHLVGHRQSVGVGEVDLELPLGVLVVERVDVPTQFVHVLDEFVEPAQVVEQWGDRVAGLFQVVPFAERARTSGAVLEDEELGFDAEIELVTHLFGGFHLPAQQISGGRLERFASDVEIGEEQRDVLAPRQHEAPVQVGVRGELLVADVLRQSVQCRAGEQLRAL